jgi:hypothetical protein
MNTGKTETQSKKRENLKVINNENLAQFTRICEKAGFNHLDVRFLATKNQYYNSTSSSSWYNINTKYGTGILIGWRKRVIYIDWSKWGFDFSYLFTKEEVTKDKTYIHAWGEKKAVEYLSAIAKEIRENPQIQDQILTYRLRSTNDLYNN